MPSHQNKLLRQIAELRRQQSNMIMHGTVADVKGDHIRMVLGKDKDGQDVLGPWTHTGNHRGGAREQKFFKKGQNVSMLNPGGDPSQGILMPYAPNKDFKRPDHASSSGQDEETYQQGEHRTKKTGTGHDQWLEDEEKDDKQGAGGGGEGGGEGGGNEAASGADNNTPDSSGKKGSEGGDKAKMKYRMNKESGITHRVAADGGRSHVHKDGAALSHGKENHVFADKDLVMLNFGGGNAVWADKDGVWSSKPIQQKDPPKKKPGFEQDNK